MGRADFKSEDDSKPAHHFRRNGHMETDMEVIVLVSVTGVELCVS